MIMRNNKYVTIFFKYFNKLIILDSLLYLFVYLVVIERNQFELETFELTELT